MQPRFPDLVVSGTLLVVVALLTHLWMFPTVHPGTGEAVAVAPGEIALTTNHGCPGGLVTCEATDDHVPWWLLAAALVAPRPRATRSAGPMTGAGARRRPTPVTDAVVLLE